jgi:hypothetical protein
LVVIRIAFRSRLYLAAIYPIPSNDENPTKDSSENPRRTASLNNRTAPNGTNIVRPISSPSWGRYLLKVADQIPRDLDGLGFFQRTSGQELGGPEVPLASQIGDAALFGAAVLPVSRQKV